MTIEEKYMLVALKEAAKAEQIDEVPIGCVVVKNGKIIAKGHNLREKTNDVSAHAEIVTLRKTNKKIGDWQLVDCELYVTIEPCLMCAGAIIQSHIKKVVYGAPDLKGGAFGSSINVLDMKNINHQPEVIGGVLQEECSNIIKNYFKRKRNKL